MRVHLETDRLILREFTADDGDLLVDLDSDPEVMFRITGGRATSREEIEGEVLPAFLNYYARGNEFGFWAAFDKRSRKFLGWFHLRPGPGHSAAEPELGYRLLLAFWGQGYATEGSTALIATAFTDLGATRVLAETMVAHAASRRVMEKCGMTVSRTFFQDWPDAIPGDELGDVEYAITLEQWASG
jgi:RimJ/RimL family protein N-acetyltransferase